MRLPVEPACYTWGAERDVPTYPSDEFVAGVMWLESFFIWNPQCRIPITHDLRAAISRLFPYQAVASSGRIGNAQELIGIITRMVDRVCVLPELEYKGTELACASLGLGRTSNIYLDDDVWLSWTDLLAQCIADNAARGSRLYALASAARSCVEFSSFDCPPGPVHWIRIQHDKLPECLVDPAAITAMKARWHKCGRPTVWEDSGHQPPLTIKRLLSRLVDDCEGIILRFGSTYFNPVLPSRCSVVGCGTEVERLCQLECCVSDGTVTVRGIFRTTAQSASEQSAALSYVRERLRLRCAEAGFTCD